MNISSTSTDTLNGVSSSSTDIHDQNTDSQWQAIQVSMQQLMGQLMLLQQQMGSSNSDSDKRKRETDLSHVKSMSDIIRDAVLKNSKFSAGAEIFWVVDHTLFHQVSDGIGHKITHSEAMVKPEVHLQPLKYGLIETSKNMSALYKGLNDLMQPLNQALVNG
ncbi:hypothetical protein D5R81_02050 [Parashewanella spongiae]|uniref:Uncharacterized protein n=1 Tax=Parashewanella spongiae TaxID=342950 RepID=A0A3A6UN10_9GAMM|nr:hypothetical protein [Parashewanella spongiae]MCL1076909.1 hypothetical protein [Parashewanella spongiae]RJY19158.1 hypothetical protein D5R81_02050 [Parashewanella spongiae]